MQAESVSASLFMKTTMHPFAFILHAQERNLGPTYNQINKSINTVFHIKMKKSNLHRWTSHCIPEIKS